MVEKAAMTGKVLIADGLATHRISLAAALDRAFYDVIVTGSGAEALRAMRRERPDLVIASTALPDLDPTRFCARAQALAGLVACRDGKFGRTARDRTKRTPLNI